MKIDAVELDYDEAAVFINLEEGPVLQMTHVDALRFGQAIVLTAQVALDKQAKKILAACGVDAEDD